MKTRRSLETLTLISYVAFITEIVAAPQRHRRAPLEVGYVVGVDGPVSDDVLHHHHLIAAHHVIVHPHILVVPHPKEGKVTHKLAIKTETHVISHDPKPPLQTVVLIPIGAHSLVVKHEVKVAHLRTHLGISFGDGGAVFGLIIGLVQV